MKVYVGRGGDKRPRVKGSWRYFQAFRKGNINGTRRWHGGGAVVHQARQTHLGGDGEGSTGRYAFLMGKVGAFSVLLDSPGSVIILALGATVVGNAWGHTTGCLTHHRVWTKLPSHILPRSMLESKVTKWQQSPTARSTLGNLFYHQIIQSAWFCELSYLEKYQHMNTWYKLMVYIHTYTYYI